ncbi:MAG: FAD-dependent oxidoreductase [Planctomycetales bacterium]|nr:FAD-dependent oxidoreductase [Planctomycetales bacterium]
MAEQALTIVIVGGVAGGASAATRARRMNEQAHIILFEKDADVSFANCGLPYYIGGEIEQRGKLTVATAELLRNRFRLDVRTRQEVTAIDRAAKSIEVRNHETGEVYRQNYDKLILSPGASPLVPPIAGRDAPNVFTLRNLADTDRIKAATDAEPSGRVVMIGAGFIGLEMVEQLAHRGFRTSLVELQPQVLPLLDAEMAIPVQRALEQHGVELHLADGIESIQVDVATGRATGVQLASGKLLPADMVILGIGVRPNTQLAEAAGLTIGPSRGIAANRHQQTNDPDVYAVGDAAEYVYGPTGAPLRIALAGPANRAGRLAGEHAATGSGPEMADVFGTSIVRVFDVAAGMTGLTAALAKRLGIDARSVTILANHHAGYFPGAKQLTLKLVYDPANGRVLGAQAVGEEGVDKRLDVIATAMAFRATVRDLAGLDLAYAPPFGAAKDPVHMAAFAACNQMAGVVDFIEADSDLTNLQVVDVRTPAEVERLPLAGAAHAINIPVDQLRDRLSELDSSRETVVSCASGVRSHVGQRILRQAGFHDVKSLAGGATLRERAMAGSKK